MILAFLLAASSPLPFVSSAVETPAPVTDPSTSLGTNGRGVGRGKAATALDAERAFAAEAQTLGQWTAFRKWAASDATMFVPQPINAQAWLKDRKDPPRAIDWWPTASYVSCDGSLAVNTGGWKRPDGAVGYFSTVWQRQQDGGWKWIVDGGDDLKVARKSLTQPKVAHASCEDKRRGAISAVVTTTGALKPGVKSDIGGSDDQSLNWLWIVRLDGSRTFMSAYWNGLEMKQAITDKIAAPK